MQAQAHIDHEVTLGVRVIKADGSEYILPSHQKTLEIPAELVQEYKQHVKRIKELEELFFEMMQEQNKE